MTFGQCVANSTIAKNNCYEVAKQNYKNCGDISGNQTNQTKKQARQECLKNYKDEMKQCKTEFANARGNCMGIKHTFFEGFRARFR